MPEHPMETTLQQIEKAIQAELYYIAVMMALALPAICAALETENAYSGRDEYKKWYRENLADKFPAMSDADCYSLRCGVVHQGNLGLKGSEFSRVIFSLPNSRRITMHNNIMNNSLQFDAVQFCHDVIASVRAWYKTHASDENVQKNLPNIIQLRPQGLSPYILGLPVIA